MVTFLVFYIRSHGRDLRPRIRKAGEASLPGKSASDPALVVYKISRSHLYFLDQVGQGTVWPEAYQQVDVDRHPVYGEQLLPFPLYDSCDVFAELLLVTLWNQGLSSFNSKDRVYVYLSVCVCHLSLGPP